MNLPKSLRASSVRIAIKASPRGTRAGFAVIEDGAGGALTFTVLPKPWADGRGTVSARHHHPGTSTHITLFELDTVEVATEPVVRDRIAQGLLDISNGVGGGVGSQDGYLLERVRLTEVDEGVGSMSVAGSLDDVIRLMLLVKRQRSSLREIGYQGSPAASLLRIVTQQMFLGELGRLMDRARPRYGARTESLGTPRGKLSAPSLALALATGRPTVESTFDELSMDTVVLRIVLAALRVVATDPAPRLLSTIAAPLHSRAVALARRLDSVTVLDRERALLACRRLAVPSLERSWKPVLDLAAEVLGRKAILPEGQEASTSHAIAISLYMEKWWEQVLADALRSCADSGTVTEQLPVPSPWTHGSPGSADLYFAFDGRTILADAKYKLDEHLIGSADAYQLFAYSYTAESTEIGRPEAAAVFYPARRGAASGTRSVLVRLTEPNFRLHLVKLPFPSRDDVLTDHSWRSFIELLASKIDAALRPALIAEAAAVT